MLPGAILGAIVLVGTLQALPLFVFLTSEVVALQALGTTFLLLVWLYVMANVIVFGAALNYVLAYGVTGREVQPKRAEPPRGPGRCPTEVGHHLDRQQSRELRGCPGPVRVASLPRVAELGDRARLALRDEHGIEAKAFLSGGCPGNRPLEHTTRDGLPAIGCDRDDHADVARLAIVVPVERLEHAPDRVARRPAGSVNPRRAAERRRSRCPNPLRPPMHSTAREPDPSAP